MLWPCLQRKAETAGYGASKKVIRLLSGSQTPNSRVPLFALWKEFSGEHSFGLGAAGDT